MSQIQKWADKFKKISDTAPSKAAQFGSDFEQPMSMDFVPHPAYWALPPSHRRHPDYDVFGHEGPLPEDFAGQHVPFGSDNIPEGVNRTFASGEVQSLAESDPLSEDYTPLQPNDGRSSGFGIGVVIPSIYKPPPGEQTGPNPSFGAEGKESGGIMSWLAPIAAIFGIWMGVEYVGKKVRNAELRQRFLGHKSA